MKDITRIHIAKIAYDIELAAKKELEKYMSALEHYAEDKETLDDIEIRITELLAERKVAAGGVITSDDVSAVRERLGEPSAFAPDDVDGVAVEADQAIQEGKRVYRDVDNALVGGVLAGIARYFGIDSLWVRLIFIVLLIPSFGTFVLLYVVLWMIVPPAKTAAQKLQSRGKPVTLESIKQLSANEKVNEVAKTTRSFLRYAGGTMLVLAGLGALIVTGFVSVGIFGIGYDGSHFVDHEELRSWWFVTALALFTIAGILLSVLMFILANSVFRKIWNKRTTAVVVSVVAAGLMTFAIGVVSIVYGSWQENVRIQSSRVSSTVDLPSDFAKVKSFVVAGDSEVNGQAQIEYIVSDKSYYEIDALPGIKPSFDIDGETATLDLKFQTNDVRNVWNYYVNGTTIKVYGPELESISADNGGLGYTNETKQDKLRISGETGPVSVSGKYITVQISSKNTLNVSLDEATVEDLDVSLFGGTVTAGVVQTLAVSQPQACPANDMSDNSVTVQSVSANKMTYNGSEVPVSTIERDCGSVIIGKDND